ncbi:MAG: hypothetical protein AB7O26_03795 [Planctomycetaceae bacterium]
MVVFWLRAASPARWLAAAGLMLTLAGCSGEKSSEFRAYKELEKSEAEKGAAEKSADSKSAVLPADSTPTAPTSGITAARIKDAVKADRPKAEPAAPAPVAPSAEPKSPVVAEKTMSEPPLAGADTTRAAAAPPSVEKSATAEVPRQRVPLRVPVIALRPGEKAPANPSGAATDPAAPRKVQLLVPTREFKSEGPQGAIRVSYDDLDLLKVLNMEPVTTDAPELMPPWLKGLDGKRIRIRGFMYPTFQETGLKGFVLARDNQICCFGRDPKIYDVFGVTLQPGVTSDYIQNRPFDVVGVFHIRPEEADGKLFNLYEISDAIVIDK